MSHFSLHVNGACVKVSLEVKSKNVTFAEKTRGQGAPVSFKRDRPVRFLLDDVLRLL